MRIAILGAGAIGAYAGPCLARGGSDVTLIARGAHLAAMQRDGVRVLSRRGDFTARPGRHRDWAAWPARTWCSWRSRPTACRRRRRGWASCCAPGAAVIWAQNGIPGGTSRALPGRAGEDRPGERGPRRQDRRRDRPEHNVGCVVYCSTEIIEPGVIRHIEGTRFTIGEPDGSATERCREISAAFAAGGLRAPVEPRLRDQIWLKLVGNVAFNPITALTRATLGELGAHARDGGPAAGDLRRVRGGGGPAGRRVPGLPRPAAGGRAGRRRPPDLDAAGPGGGQAAGAGLHDRGDRGAGRADGRRRPAHPHRARVRPAAGSPGRGQSRAAASRGGARGTPARAAASRRDSRGRPRAGRKSGRCGRPPRSGAGAAPRRHATGTRGRQGRHAGS